MKKRVLSLLLALAVLFSWLPLTDHAAASWAEEVELEEEALFWGTLREDVDLDAVGEVESLDDVIRVQPFADPPVDEGSDLSEHVTMDVEVRINQKVYPDAFLNEEGIPQVTIDTDTPFSYSFNWSLPEQMYPGKNDSFTKKVFTIPGLNLKNIMGKSALINDGGRTVKIGTWDLTYDQNTGEMLFTMHFNEFAPSFRGIRGFKKGSGKFTQTVSEGTTISIGDQATGAGTIHVKEKVIPPSPPVTPVGPVAQGWKVKSPPGMKLVEYDFGKGVKWSTPEDSDEDPHIEWRAVFLDELQTRAKALLEYNLDTLTKGAGTNTGSLADGATIDKAPLLTSEDYYIIEDVLDSNQEYIFENSADGKYVQGGPFFLEIPIIIPGTGEILNGRIKGNYEPDTSYDGSGDTGDHIITRAAFTRIEDAGEYASIEERVHNTPLSFAVIRFDGENGWPQEKLVLNVGKLGTTDPTEGLVMSDDLKQKILGRIDSGFIDESKRQIRALEEASNAPVVEAYNQANRINNRIKVLNETAEWDPEVYQTVLDRFAVLKAAYEAAYTTPEEKSSALDTTGDYYTALSNYMAAVEALKAIYPELEDEQGYVDAAAHFAGLTANQAYYVENRQTLLENWHYNLGRYQMTRAFYEDGRIYGFTFKYMTEVINPAANEYSNAITVKTLGKERFVDVKKELKFNAGIMGLYSLGAVVFHKGDSGYLDPAGDEMQSLENLGDQGIYSVKFKVYDAVDVNGQWTFIEDDQYLNVFAGPEASANGNAYVWSHVKAAEDPEIPTLGDIVELETDQSGVLAIEGLTPSHPHYLVEQNVPFGYYSDRDPLLFEVDENGVLYKFVPNVERAARLHKISSYDESPVEGATFALYNAANDAQLTGFLKKDFTVGDSTIPVYWYYGFGPKTMTTDENGVLRVGKLLPGDYYLKEVAPAAGYELTQEEMDTKYSFTITEENPGNLYIDGGFEFVLANPSAEDAGTPEPIVNDLITKSLTLTKVDEYDQGLSGAGFKVWQWIGSEEEFEAQEDPTLWKEVVWNQENYPYFMTTASVDQNTVYVSAEGSLLLEGLVAGHYKMEETVVPESYKGVSEPLYFTVDNTDAETVLKDANGQALEDNKVVNRQDPGALEVVKRMTSSTGDEQKPFQFTLTMKDKLGTPLTGDYTALLKTVGAESVTKTLSFDAQGQLVFELKANQSLEIQGLPAQSVYHVMETEDPDYQATWTGDSGSIEPNQTVQAIAENELKSGSLRVSKTVSGLIFPIVQDYEFTLSIPEMANQTASIVSEDGLTTEDLVFNGNGEATFTLQRDEAVLLTGLPSGAKYTLTETAVENMSARITKTETEDATTEPDVTKIEGRVVTGIVSSSASVELAYDNFWDGPEGNLEVVKFVQGLQEDPEEEFNIDITIFSSSGQPVNATFPGYRGISASQTAEGHTASTTGTEEDIVFVDGIASVKLKHREYLVVTGLPVDIEYRVDEVDDLGFENPIDGYDTVITDNRVGYLPEEQPVVIIKNIVNTTRLAVEKTVTGRGAEEDRDFEFTIRLDDESYVPVTGEYSYVGSVIEGYETSTLAPESGTLIFDENGEAKITLRHGQRIEILGLPMETYYEVIETPVDEYYTAALFTTGKLSNEEVMVAVFENAINLGGLSVTKTVTGNAGDKQKDFTFTVTLSDSTINGSYGEMEFVDGVASFTLKDGQTLTASELPVGMTYTVEESDNEGYTVTSQGATGTIATNTTAFAKFNNHKDSFGSLQVAKTVTGNVGDKQKDFTFTVTLSDLTVNGVFGDMTFVDGVATFTLKDGETKTATGLLAGLTYTVEESDNAGYTVTKTGDTGTLVEGQPQIATFNNHKDVFGDLSVSKTVTGNAGDKQKDFTFTVTLDDTTVNGEYGEMTFVDGVATFTLKDGETKTATGLLAGTKYTVVEGSEADYVVKAENAAGSILADQTAEAHFNNHKDVFADLSVSKTVTGNAGDKQKDFTFTVTLSDLTVNGLFGDMTFVDGVATFTLKDGETKTATGLLAGLTYTVEESDNAGYTVTKTGDTGTLVEGQPQIATFNNHKDVFGDLSVSKTVTGNAGDKQKDFTFTVTLDDTTVNGEFGDMTFVDGVATFTLKDGETRTTTGLLAGITYTVEETDNEGYTVTSEGETGSIMADAQVSASFNNHKDTFGSLQVKKTVTGNAGDKEKAFTFTVTLDDTTVNGVYGDMTFVDGVASFTLTDGQTKTATGLLTGISYTVEESDNEGYTVTKTGDTGTLVEGQPQIASFNNHKDVFGDLSVSKTVTGNAGDREKAFTFTVTLDDATVNGTYGEMTFVDGVATFTLKDGESKMATGLLAGITYTVEEADNEGYTVMSEGETGSITANEAAEVSFNNHKDVFGDLSVSKIVTGNAGDKQKDFTFTVTLNDKSVNGKYGDMTFTDGVATFTLKNGESKTATGLLAGITYTVEETDNEGYTVTSEGETGSITANETTEVSFNNHKDVFGDLKVSKTVTGNAGDKQKDFTFTVTLDDTTVNGEYGEMTFVDGVATFTLKDGETKTATGLLAGMTYTVEETDNEGYTVTSEGETGSIVANETTEVSFNNHKDVFGDLSVSKTVTGNAGDKQKDFTFTVTLDDTTVNGEYGEMIFVDGVATFTLKDGETKTAEGLLAGTKYTVVEKAEADYVVKAENAAGSILADKTAEAHFNNHKDVFGDLKVSKKVTGNAGDKEKAFTFTVTLNDKSVNGKYGDMTFTDGVATFTLKDGESKTATGLLAGITYTVEESENTGYEVSATGETGSIVADTTTEVSFTNNLDEFGTLKVTKQVTGTAGEQNKEFTFTVTLSDKTLNGKYGDMNFTNGVASFKLRSGDTRYGDDLPAGLTYTVEESDNEGYTVTKTGETGTILKDKEVEAVFINHKDAVGNLSVSKTVTGNAGDKEKDFTFTVTLSDKSVNGKYGDMTFVDGFATFTLKDGQTKTAEGLLAGLTYSVEESGIDGYRVTATNAEGTLLANATKEVTFHNHKDVFGDLSVSKTVSGNGGDKEKDFAFTITLSDTSLTGKYGEMDFVDGVATFTLKDGQTKTAEGLLAGLTYTVEESENEGYVVSATGQTGSIEEDHTAVVIFHNHRDVFGSLSVSKTVTGTAGDKEKDFTFTVTLDDQTVNGRFGEMDFVDGVASFTLKNGEKKTATDLLAGITYTVEESDNEGYTVQSEKEMGTVLEDQTLEVVFNNHKDAPEKPDKPDEPVKPDKPDKPEEPDKPVTPVKPEDPKKPEAPKTGDDGRIYLFAGIAITGLLGMAVFAPRRRKEEREEA